MNEQVERKGRVIAIEENGMARVRLERASACGGCGSRGTCASASGMQEIRLHLAKPAQPGDGVSVSMPASSVVLAAVLGYLLPPLGLIAGAVFCDLTYDCDMASVIGAGAGFIGGLLLARLIAFFTLGKHQGTADCPTDFHSDSLSGEHE